MVKTRARFALRPTLISLAVASCFTAGTALANPTGANVVQGTAAIHQAGNLLQITNSPNAIINWQSFSIGANEITRFIQQSASSAVLNRVTTQNPSTILGALQSNGRVFLINPNGILFGAGAQVDVAGLVASTLNMSDQDFLAGRMRFADGLGKSVVNEGSINTGAGGSVYLIGSGVANNGIITSPRGEVVLAAGNSVELVSPGTPNLRVEIAASDQEARNLGQIISDAGRIGIYAGLINNSGTIRADSAVAEGGRIVLKATKSITLEDSSVLSAQGQGGGRIEVLAGEGVQVAGRLDASAPNGGDGGFIETSAAKVTFDSSTAITTAAPFGKTGTWLIDPADFTIAATLGDITGALLSTNLGLTSVTIVSDDGLVNPSGTGSIFVNDTVSWSSGNNLVLIARGNVDVNSSVTNTGTGGIAMYAGWDGVSRTDPNVTCCAGGSINLFAPISTAGTAVLVASFGISQDVNGSISAANLLAKSTFSSVALDGATNNVGTLTGEASGSFHFKNGPSLIVGSVDSGNTVIGTVAGVASTSSNDVAISVTAGDLTVNNNILAAGGNSNNADIVLTANNNLIANSVLISAQGNPGEGPGNASVTLTAQNGGITLNNSTVEAISTGPGCCSTDGNATLSMNAGGNITLSSSSAVVTGAVGGTGTPGGTASATLTAGGVIQLTPGSLSVGGGDGGAGFSSINGGAGGSATVMLNASSGITVNGSIGATGGAGASSANGGNAIVMLTGNGISVNNGLVFAQGGSGDVNGGAGSVTLNGGAGGILVQNSALLCQTGCLVQLIDVTTTAISRVTGSGVAAVGGSGGSTGGAATVMLNTTGGITVNNTTVGAAGGDTLLGAGGMAHVTLTSGGDITLASNVIADGGLGALGPALGRLDLVFLSSSSNYFVNGQAGVIFDSTTGSGFLVNGAPAILGTNLFVTQGAPVFTDVLVATINQQADVLADQLKAGDTPGDTEDKDKKKLPFCTS